MRYQDDPNIDRRQSYPMTSDRVHTGWIVGGILAFAVICGLFFTFGSKTERTNTAATEPTTTGSATSDIPKPPTTPAVPAKPDTDYSVGTPNR